MSRTETLPSDMKRTTERRTKAVRVARSRSHALVEPASRTFRIRDMDYNTLRMAPPSTCTVAPVM